MDRMENIVTEEEDRKEEEKRIRSALKECGYPKWAMDRVKQQITDRPQKPTMTKKDNYKNSCGVVIILYVEGVSEKIKRIYSKHDIHTAMKPTNTIKSIIVHPKDKQDIAENSDVVYDVPWDGYKKSYIRETGRQFRIRLKEHQKDVEKQTDKQKSPEPQERLPPVNNISQLSPIMLPKLTTSLTGRKKEFSTGTLTNSQERFANLQKSAKMGHGN